MEFWRKASNWYAFVSTSGWPLHHLVLKHWTSNPTLWRLTGCNLLMESKCTHCVPFHSSVNKFIHGYLVTLCLLTPKWRSGLPEKSTTDLSFSRSWMHRLHPIPYLSCMEHPIWETCFEWKIRLFKSLNTGERCFPLSPLSLPPLLLTWSRSKTNSNSWDQIRGDRRRSLVPSTGSFNRSSLECEKGLEGFLREQIKTKVETKENKSSPKLFVSPLTWRKSPGFRILESANNIMQALMAIGGKTTLI